MGADVKEYLDGLGVKFSAREDWNDNSSDVWYNSRHFRVKVAYSGKSFTIWFYQGIGVQGVPTVEGVIECLLSDRSFVHNGLEEFGYEFGWNKDTLRTFRLMKSNSNKLERVFNDEILTKLDSLLFG